MLERHLQDYLFQNPSVLFPGQPIERKQREVVVAGRRVDLLFEVDGTHWIVELKRHQIEREHIGQIFEYYGLLRRANPDKRYRMILAAPVIPDYRRVALEDFGIRCVEVAMPGLSEVAPEATGTAASPALPLNAKLPRQRPRALAEIDAVPPPQIRFENLISVNRNSLRLTHLLVRDTLPAVQKAFIECETVPVRMVSPHTADVLCFPGRGAGKDAPVSFQSAGAWWAFAFGRSETMPKNDVPNLSASAMPGGLDLTVNAELRTSQAVMRARIQAGPNRFNTLLREHGTLHLQAWLKLEHQPRFYHWISLLDAAPGTWDGENLLAYYRDAASRFPALRAEWLEKVQRAELTAAQLDHMRSANRNLNMALRLVHRFAPDSPFWTVAYQEQIESLNTECRKLKPMLDFFLDRQ